MLSNCVVTYVVRELCCGFITFSQTQDPKAQYNFPYSRVIDIQTLISKWIITKCMVRFGWSLKTTTHLVVRLRIVDNSALKVEA